METKISVKPFPEGVGVFVAVAPGANIRDAIVEAIAWYKAKYQAQPTTVWVSPKAKIAPIEGIQIIKSRVGGGVFYIGRAKQGEKK